MTQISLLNLEFESPSLGSSWSADLTIGGVPLGAVRSIMPGHLEFTSIEDDFSCAYVLNMCEAITLNGRHTLPTSDKCGPITLYDLCAMEVSNAMARRDSRLSVVVNNDAAAKKLKSNVRRVSQVLAFEHDESVDVPLARAC